MADLFGEWVPDEWIETIINVCLETPRHRYLFLTKNPARYIQLYDKGMLPEKDNFWYGTTATNDLQPVLWSKKHNTFYSIEPMLSRFEIAEKNRELFYARWIIIGAETGNRRNKVTPKKEWIDEIVNFTKDSGVSIFMKESLREIMGSDFRQQFPW